MSFGNINRVPPPSTAGGGGGSGAAISAGTQSTGGGTVVFSNSNGISFGMSGSSRITAIYTVPSVTEFLTTAMASNRGSDFVQATAAFAGTSASGTIASNGISVSIGPYITTAMLSNAATISNVRISAGTTNTLFSNFSFADGSGVSFGLNGSTITASVQTNYLTTAMASNRGSDFVAATAGFNGTNASGTMASNSWSVSVAAQTNQSIGLYMSSNTTSSVSSGTVDARSMTFRGVGVASVGYSGGEVIISVPAGGGGITNIVLAANGTTNSLSSIILSNSNNMTFGLNASTVTASCPISFSAGGANANLTNVVFSNSNSVSFGLNGSTITASYGEPLISSYENMVGYGSSTFTQSMNPGSVSIAVAFNLPEPISASFIRVPIMLTTNSTTLSTAAASLSGSADAYTTFNAVVYSLGVGANSRSLQSVASGSQGWTMRNSISVGADGTSGSYSQYLTVGAEGANTTFSTQTTIANTNYSFVTASLTNFTGSRFLDIPFANSLSKGPYWLIIGMTTSSSSNSARISAATNCRVGYASHQVAAQWNVNFGIMGSTNLTSGGLLGMGSFSTAGGGTTASLPISAISSSASNARPYFQLLRSA